MKKVAFYTLGCKVNQYESEAILEIFQKAGYETVNFDEKADVYIINTCTVTSLSDRKSRQMIRKAKKTNENAIVVVMGCYAQTSPEEVSGIPGVNLILGTKDRLKIIEYIEEIEAHPQQINRVDSIMTTRDFEELQIDQYKERTRAFLKIQEGCSQFCAYCIIPYARGPIRSRASGEVIEEVVKLAGHGFKEIVLTGIHLASYGKDIKGTSLLEIIQTVHKIEGIERIRLGSIEPNTVTEEFTKAAGQLTKLCPHYHISLQSGCDATLQRMNRKYDTAYYWNAVEALRRNIPDVAITTDVMVGFPGETEEEFAQTLSFLEDIHFAQMHVFKFSPRKGTPAADFENQVSPGEKEARSSRLIALSRDQRNAYIQSFMGCEMPVLIEQESDEREGWVEGFTPNYIKVLCEGTSTYKGQIVRVRLEKIEQDFALGSIVV